MLRTSIESEVIRKLTNIISDSQLELLEDICLEQENAMQSNDEIMFINLDQTFHLTLTRFANYELVEQVLLNLHDLSTLIGLQAVKAKNRMAEVLEEHRKIIASMATLDAEKAAESIIKHLAKTRQSVS